jgi:hypothetical protein
MIDAIIDNENVDINLKILGKILKLENALSFKVLEQLESRKIAQIILVNVIDRLDSGSRAGRFERELKFIDITMKIGDNRMLIEFVDVEKLWKIVYEKNKALDD